MAFSLWFLFWWAHCWLYKAIDFYMFILHPDTLFKVLISYKSFLVGPLLNVELCSSSLLLTAMINHCDQSLQEERVYLASTARCKQELKQSPWRSAAYWLHSAACSATLLKHPKPLCLGMVLPTVGLDQPDWGIVLIETTSSHVTLGCFKLTIKLPEYLHMNKVIWLSFSSYSLVIFISWTHSWDFKTLHWI